MIIELPKLTENSHNLKATYTHSKYGKVELSAWRKIDHAVVPSRQRYGWTLNNGTYGSNLDSSLKDLKILFKAIQLHNTTSNFKVI